MDKTVLLLDDNELQLMTRHTILRQAGYSVHAALNAADALAIAQDPDKGSSLRLIITDHLMPSMRGDAFVREVRKSLPDVAIIVITGHPEAEADYEGLDVNLLPKPCPPECLLSHAADAFQAPLHRIA